MVFEVSTNMALQLRLRLSQGFYRVFQFKTCSCTVSYALHLVFKRGVTALCREERLHHGFRRLVLRLVGFGLDSGSWGFRASGC